MPASAELSMDKPRASVPLVGPSGTKSKSSLGVN